MAVDLWDDTALWDDPPGYGLTDAWVADTADELATYAARDVAAVQRMLGIPPVPPPVPVGRWLDEE
jgi:pimeloyl-ACP methyl ester carboxylesterase